jgi:hypothetical protein
VGATVVEPLEPVLTGLYEDDGEGDGEAVEDEPVMTPPLEFALPVPE